MKIPFVLVSGLLSNETLWKHQAIHLKDIASIQVVSPSQNTSRKMVQEILENAPSSFILAGHSMGGWLCLEVLRAAPSRVLRLCLLNTTARGDSEEKKRGRQQMIQRVKEGGFREVVREIVEKFVFNPAVKNEVERMFLEVGAKTFVHQEEAMLARDECLSILPTIDCPTLVVHAAEDKNFSLEEHRELASSIKGAALAIVENSGHMSPMEAPQAITALLKSIAVD